MLIDRATVRLPYSSPLGQITTLGEEILACYAEEERMNEALQNHAFIHAVRKPRQY